MTPPRLPSAGSAFKRPEGHFAAALIEQLDIVKAGIAKLAIPRCNLVSMTGTEMQTALNGYLNALYDFSPELVGGELPDADFYLV